MSDSNLLRFLPLKLNRFTRLVERNGDSHGKVT